MRTILIAAATLALVTGASALDECVPSTSPAAVEAGGFYLAGNAMSLFCNPTCLIDIWVYEEDNGIAGLQRGDEIVDDTCGGQIQSDQIVL